MSSCGARARARADERLRGSRAAFSRALDDMVNVRGVNVYPSAVEAVVRRFGDVANIAPP